MCPGSWLAGLAPTVLTPEGGVGHKERHFRQKIVQFLLQEPTGKTGEQLLNAGLEDQSLWNCDDA